MKPPVWLRSAERSREKQLDYYATLNPLAAIDMDAEIDRVADLLGENPKMGRKGRVAGTLEVVMSGAPFVLVYRLNAGAPEILRVLHQSQQWPPTKAKARRVTVAMK